MKIKKKERRNNGVIRSDDAVNHSLDEKYKIPVRETETKNPCCSSYLLRKFSLWTV